MKKVLIYIIGLTLIVSNSITFLGGILGLIGFMNQSLEETIRLLNIQPIFPKLIYWGVGLGFITAPIYIFAGSSVRLCMRWFRRRRRPLVARMVSG